MTSGDCDQHVSSRIRHSFFPSSLSISPSDILDLQFDGNVQNLLETGVSDDALYISNVRDVACTILKCNKRISVVGQERSVGRPGNRPIGARDTTCNPEMCLGPYATCNTV